MGAGRPLKGRVSMTAGARTEENGEETWARTASVFRCEREPSSGSSSFEANLP